jgi:hypothetical protein
MINKKRLCDTNKNVTKLDVIIKEFYYNIVEVHPQLSHNGHLWMVHLERHEIPLWAVYGGGIPPVPCVVLHRVLTNVLQKVNLI